MGNLCCSPSPPVLRTPKKTKSKIVLVGNTAAGKTCMISNYLGKQYDEDFYVPTVLDVYKGKRVVSRIEMELEIHDTSGEDENSPIA